jgi:hypothetical protein
MMEDEGFDAPAMAEEQVDAVQEDVQSALAEIEDGEGAADEAETLRERWTRDERGRFTPHQAREGGGEQRGEDEVQPARAPDYWKAEFGDFGRLPPQVQNAILTREAQIHRFASDAGRRLKVWEPVEQALAEGFRARGGTSIPDYLVSLASAENHIFQDATSGRPTFEALDWLARSYYGTDLATIAGLRAQAPQVDPMVQGLADRLAQIEEAQDARAQYEQELRRQELWNEYETFAKDKPLANDPAMMQIMQRLLLSQEALTFQEAYEKASWLHAPAREAMQKAERQSAVRRARAAAISPRAASPSPGVVRTGTRQTIEEDVRAALEELT